MYLTFFLNGENNQQCCRLTISSRTTSQEDGLGIGCSDEEKQLKRPQLLENDKEKGGQDYSPFEYWDLIDVLTCWLLSLLPPLQMGYLPYAEQPRAAACGCTHNYVCYVGTQTHVNRWSFLKCHNPSCRLMNKNAIQWLCIFYLIPKTWSDP